jgi:hypothetical protein
MVCAIAQHVLQSCNLNDSIEIDDNAERNAPELLDDAVSKAAQKLDIKHTLPMPSLADKFAQ